MAKDKLAETNKNTALATNDFAPTLMVGEEQGDMILPALHVFQGQPKETKTWGEHPLGAVLHGVTREALFSPPKDGKQYPYDMPRFIPIAAWSEYIAWQDDRNLAPLYIERDVAKIKRDNPDDLVWGSGKDGKGCRAQRYINYVGVFEDDPGLEPVVIKFTKKGIAHGRTINTMERRRAASKRCGGAYIIPIVEEENDHGIWYAYGPPRDGGDPGKDILDRVNELREGIVGALQQNTLRTEDAGSVANEEEAGVRENSPSIQDHRDTRSSPF